MIGTGWGEVTLEGIVLGLVIVFGPIIYGTVITVMANRLLEHEDDKRQVRNGGMGVTFIV